MACNNPIPAYQTEEGAVIRFTPTLNSQRLDIPCGKCLGCRSNQALMWAIRCYHEASQHEQNCFVTLTYNDEHLPADGKIDKAELQRFWKRIRKSGNKVRYFACGEYGDKTRRPHYHAIIFGQDFRANSEPIGQNVYTLPDLLKFWSDKNGDPLGNIMIGNVELASIMYVCGYTAKKNGDPDTFTLMSRRPGIGAEWLKKNMDDLHRTGTVTMNGTEFPIPPRYYAWTADEFTHIKRAQRERLSKTPYKPWQTNISREINLRGKNQQKEEKI